MVIFIALGLIGIGAIIGFFIASTIMPKETKISKNFSKGNNNSR